MNIRLMTANDVNSVAPLLCELGYPVAADELAERFQRLDPGREVAFLAENGGEVRGWIHLVRRDTLLVSERIEIVGLIVAGTARGTGLGKRLVAQGLEWARQNGVFRIRVTSNLKRRESHLFYRRLGFELTKESAVYDLPLPLTSQVIGH